MGKEKYLSFRELWVLLSRGGRIGSYNFNLTLNMIQEEAVRGWGKRQCGSWLENMKGKGTLWRIRRGLGTKGGGDLG